MVRLLAPAIIRPRSDVALPTPTMIQVRQGISAWTNGPAPGGYLVIPAYRFYDWAAHRHLDKHDDWVLTLLPLGANLPPDWATFKSPEGAFAAAMEIQRSHNGWATITQDQMSLPLKARLMDIVRKHGALDGVAGICQRADMNIFGVRKETRPNGYGKALG